MSSKAKQYSEGHEYQVYNRKGDKFLFTLKIPETMCKAGLDRLMFFKYNIAPGEYTVKRINIIGE